MPYSSPDTMNEVANILEDFDEETLQDVFKSQIISDDSYVSVPVNHFQPLHLMYKRATSIDIADEDDIGVIRTRYHNICISIIGYISSKFGISVDLEWVESQYGKLPAIAMALYQFFVLDLFYIILNVMNNYISKNIDDLFNAFVDNVSSKDVSTLANMKMLDPKYATIISSMYDVTDYAFTMLDPDSFFEYITDSAYVPKDLLQMLYDQGVINGDFVRSIADMYKENLSLRSKITFELVYRIRNRGALVYSSTIKDAVNLPDATLTNLNHHHITDIDDDEETN